MRQILFSALLVLLLLAPPVLFAQPVEELVGKLAKPENAPDAVFKLSAKGKDAANALIKALSSSDAGVRYHALWALTLIGDKSAGPAAVKLLRDANSLVRLRAVFAAAALTPKEVMPVLERLASDPDALVRAAAATVLADRKEPAVAAALLKSLELHKNRFSAIALVSHGKAGAPGLRKLLESEDAVVRRMACFALGQIRDKNSIDALSAAAKDENPDVALSAAVALALMHQDEAYSLLAEALKKRGQSVEEIKDILKDMVDFYSNVNKATLNYKDFFAKLGSYRFLASIPALVQGLRTARDTNLRVVAARALGEIGSNLALGALLQAAGDKDKAVRLAVAAALGKIAAREAVAPLRQLSYDPDPGVRAAAAAALAQLDIRDLSPIFKRMSQDPQGKVRQAAFQALDIYPPSFAEPIFISLLKREKDPEAKALLVKLLGRIATENALHVIIKEADAREKQVRLAAIEALGNFSEERAGQKLVAILKKSEDDDEKAAAARALGKNRSDLAEPVLIELFTDAKGELKLAAAEALGNIKSQAAFTVLRKQLNEADDQLAIVILEALGKVALPGAYPHILLVARRESKSIEVRRTAVLALGGFKGEEKVKSRLAGFLSKDELAAEAAIALQKMGDSSGLPSLGRLLHKPDAGERLRAVKALRHMDSKEATAMLFAAAKDIDDKVALTAALELLGRSKFEALAILHVLLARKETREKLRKVMKEFELAQVLHPVMEKLTTVEEIKTKMAIMELLGHLGIADFKIPADASLADYQTLAARWLRWWEATVAKLPSGPGRVRKEEGETEKAREGTLKGLDWLKKRK